MTVQSCKTLSLSRVRLIAVVIFQSFNDAKCVNQLTNQHNNSVRGIERAIERPLHWRTIQDTSVQHLLVLEATS